MGYNITVNSEGEQTLTFVDSNGILVTVNGDHPEYVRIAEALIKGTDPNSFLSISNAVQGIDGVTVTDNDVYFNGVPVHGSIVSAILRFRREGRDTDGLVRFLERLQQNPSRHSREQLYDWLNGQGLQVDPEGYILAHKAVQKASREQHEFTDGEGDESASYLDGAWQFNGYDLSVLNEVEDCYQSISQGTAFVNGVEFTGSIPNFVGAVVTMPRKEVDDDYRRDCSYGLHIGSFNYAKSFGPYVTEVRVAPEDVVSVPQYDTNKMRCCRYEVLSVQESPQPDLSHWESPATWDEDDALDDIEDVLVADSAPRSWLERWRQGRQQRKLGLA